MHPFSVLTFGIFVAGYITARWDLVTRLYDLAIFAWNYGVVTRAASGFIVLSAFFLVIFVPFARLAAQEASIVRLSLNMACEKQLADFLHVHLQHPRKSSYGLSAREQLRRRGSL